jgi:hypothetical protein
LGLDSLVAFGMTESSLRWLAAKGYVEHACEITQSLDPARRFRPNGNMAFPKRTCFVLTDAGESYAAAVMGRSVIFAPSEACVADALPMRSMVRPRWDARQRALYFGPSLVKRYKLPSPNQEAILAAFEEEGWPHRVDDPLAPQPEQDPKCRLHDTIKRLNRHHREPLLRFQGDGTGDGICWAVATEAAVTGVLPLRRAA